MRTIVEWLLGGALAASLAWNWKLASKAAEPSPECAESCASVDPSELGLTEEQRAALGELCDRSCAESSRLEQRANELQDALLAKLAEGEADPAATDALVSSLVDLRRRSLEACVSGIRDVRGLLTPEQASALVSRCRSGAGTCR
jgi:Spy/CpxP family protein refolding chaperone